MMTAVNLFPPSIAICERNAEGDPCSLRGREVETARAYASKRVAEFAAGRDCARRALRRFGSGEVVIERGADGAPVWPAAFVGSITHTPGYCVAVAARRDEFASVGIDAEWADRLTVDLWHDVFVARELDVLAQASPAERERIAIVMFSAKETFYKCQAPLTQMWIDFTEVAIDVTFASPSRGDFVVVPMSGATRERFGHLALRGRFRFDGLLVVTGMVARAGSATW